MYLQAPFSAAAGVDAPAGANASVSPATIAPDATTDHY
jgi:hypothetical protein